MRRPRQPREVACAAHATAEGREWTVRNSTPGHGDASASLLGLLGLADADAKHKNKHDGNSNKDKNNNKTKKKCCNKNELCAQVQGQGSGNRCCKQRDDGCKKDDDCCGNDRCQNRKCRLPN
jgi:hypothetical protein